MTYYELIKDAEHKLNFNKITLGEYEEMIKPLNQEIEQEPFMNKPCVAHQVCHEDKVKVLDKIKAEIDQKQYDFMADKDYDEGVRFGLMLAYQIIDKYKAESEVNE